jgi:hypothetical protein
MSPERKENQVYSRRELQWEPHIPKKEGGINPINPCVELAMLARPQGKNRPLLAQFLSA